jgi:hypothetical protein
MSGPFLFSRHGAPNRFADYGLIDLGLDWEDLKLKAKKPEKGKEERDREVVRRSNYYLYCMPLLGDLSNQVDEAKDKAGRSEKD